MIAHVPAAARELSLRDEREPRAGPDAGAVEACPESAGAYPGAEAGADRWEAGWSASAEQSDAQEPRSTGSRAQVVAAHWPAEAQWLAEDVWPRLHPGQEAVTAEMAAAAPAPALLLRALVAGPGHAPALAENDAPGSRALLAHGRERASRWVPEAPFPAAPALLLPPAVPPRQPRFPSSFPWTERNSLRRRCTSPRPGHCFGPQLPQRADAALQERHPRRSSWNASSSRLLQIPGVGRG